MDPESIERYDRQIRLWGQHGQNKCSNASVCLVNANALGLEILKGLCLAGIGSFSIIDSHKLTAEDVGCSFLSQSCIGKSRAESARSMLLDLNEQVSGKVFSLERYLPHVISNNNDLSSGPGDDDDDDDDNLSRDDETFFKQFNCVIVSGFLYTSQIARLSKICWRLNIPLILCKSAGFFGSMRCQVREHTVAESHPEWLPANHDPDKVEPVIIGTTKLDEDYSANKCEVTGDDDEDEFITISVCLRALDLFFSTYGRLPGYRIEQVETDVGKLKEYVKQLSGKSAGKLKSSDQCLYELCRYGGAELHPTSAFMGGCVAQEVIKFVTNQYVPVDDTLVYNAMSAMTKTFKSDKVFSAT